MAPGISLDDRNAWDDTALIDSWDEALAEYKKYYSIQASGKRLEDVLSEEELKALRGDYGDVMDEVKAKEEEEEEGEISSMADPNNTTNDQNVQKSIEETNGNALTEQPTPSAEEPSAPGAQAQTSAAEALLPQAGGEAVAASMPQAILGTVQDDNLKNLMMSWYYAGYYTGLHTGQQQPVPKND